MEYSKLVKKSVGVAKEKLDVLRAEDSLVFALFTDLHTGDSDSAYTKRLTTALAEISDEISPDAVINMGDSFAMLGRDIHITNDELKARFERVFEAVYKASGCPVIHVNGNHDAPGTDFFKADYWNEIVKGKYGNTNAVYGDGAYYYIDYDNADTRLVVMSLPSDSDIDCQMPTPIWKFGKNQLKWLSDVAFDTDKKVIILNHVPFYDKYTGDENATLGVWTGTEEKVSYISALCGSVEDLEDALVVIKKNEDKLVACLSGHTHTDGLFAGYEEKNGVKNPLHCPQVVTNSACFTEDAGLKMDMGISIDIVLWTPSKMELNLLRIGDGEDRKVL